jgi:hypothetical protein
MEIIKENYLIEIKNIKKLYVAGFSDGVIIYSSLSINKNYKVYNETSINWTYPENEHLYFIDDIGWNIYLYENTINELKIKKVSI